jgi:hypothetical protein
MTTSNWMALNHSDLRDDQAQNPKAAGSYPAPQAALPVDPSVQKGACGPEARWAQSRSV